MNIQAMISKLHHLYMLGNRVDTDPVTYGDLIMVLSAGLDEAPRSKFVPPTLEEVKAYCVQRGNSVDPEGFLNHYTASKWMRGKTRIRDWQACVRTWEKNAGFKQGAQVDQSMFEQEDGKL